MENQSRSTHPMIIVAATAVTIASLAAIASISGWLPTSKNNEATPTAQVAVEPTTAPSPPALSAPTAATPEPVPTAAAPKQKTPATTTKAAPRKLPKPVENTNESTPNYNNRGATPVSNSPMNDSGVYVENSRQQPSNTCRDCATVESVREVKQSGEGTGLGAVGGGVVGGLLGNQIGGGRGKTLGAVVGAVGGAFAGNEVEKKVRSTTQFEITVHLDDGTTRVFTESQAPGLQRGDRVRISNGQLNRI